MIARKDAGLAMGLMIGSGRCAEWMELQANGNYSSQTAQYGEYRIMPPDQQPV